MGIRKKSGKGAERDLDNGDLLKEGGEG